MGDRSPSDIVQLIRGLLPGIPDNPLFEVVLLDLLPKNACDAALHFSSLDEMAAAADKVVAENAAEIDRPAVNAVGGVLDGQLGASALSQEDDEHPWIGAVGGRSSAAKGVRDQPSDNLCVIHSTWGRDAYRCSGPDYCLMKDQIRPKPPKPKQSSSASGNGKAGRQ